MITAVDLLRGLGKLLGWRVIAVDLPPFGYSERDAEARYDRTAQARRLAAVVEAQARRPAVVVIVDDQPRDARLPDRRHRVGRPRVHPRVALHGPEGRQRPLAGQPQRGGQRMDEGGRERRHPDEHAAPGVQAVPERKRGGRAPGGVADHGRQRAHLFGHAPYGGGHVDHVRALPFRGPVRRHVERDDRAVRVVRGCELERDAVAIRVVVWSVSVIESGRRSR